MTRSLALALPLSVILHATLIVATLTIAPRPDAEPAIFIDLTLTDPSATAWAGPGSRASAAVGGTETESRQPSPTRSASSGQRPSGWSTLTARARPAPAGRARSPVDERPLPVAPSASATTGSPAEPAPRNPDAAGLAGPRDGAQAAPRESPSPSTSMPWPAGSATPPERRVGVQPEVAAPRAPAAPSSPPSSSAASGAGANVTETTAAGTKLDGSGPGTDSRLPHGVGPRGGESRSGGPGPGRSDSGRGDGVLAAIDGGDTPGTEYGSYLARIRQRIAESLRYPPAARRRQLTGTVQLEIVIAVSGAITAAEVVVSSSHAVLDAAAVETVTSLGPEPFPPHVRARTLRVRLPVVFRLQ